MSPSSRTPSVAASRGRVLVIDDEDAFARVLVSILSSRGYEVSACSDATEALARALADAPDAVVLDQSMPGLTGLEILAELKRNDPSIAVVILSGSIEVADAVRAIRAGAEDVQTKPPDLELLSAALDRGLARTALMRSRRLAETQVADPYGLLDESPAMQRIRRQLEGLSRSTLPALIVGEAGTGKGAVAAMLHQMSPLASQPFVRLECGDRPPEVVERELLELLRPDGGRTPIGNLAKTTGGTLYLERVGVLTDRVQSLLHALLDARVHERHAWVPSNLRLIASTRRDLAADVRAGVLRPELHQLLAVMPIHVPSLRDRGAQAVLTLARRALARHRLELGEGPLQLTEGAERMIAAFEWPGNARQLHAVLEEAFVLALTAEALDEPHLRQVVERRGFAPAADAPAEDLSLNAMERLHIRRVLAAADGNRTHAARLLGITRTTLYKKLADYGIVS